MPSLIKCRVCRKDFDSKTIQNHELNCLKKLQEEITPSSSNVKTDSRENNKERKNEANKALTDSFLEHELNCMKKLEGQINSNSSESSTDEEKDDVGDGSSGISASSPGFSRNPRSSSNVKKRGTVGVSRGHSGHANRDQRSHQVPAQRRHTTASMRYDRKKEDNLFPPTKKYRYYPITCDYCGKRLQPNKMKAHQAKKHNLGETRDGRKLPKRAQSAAMRKGYDDTEANDQSKSAGAMPRGLQICYICGRMYGSKSLKIHEPKCLEKWRAQNKLLPPGRRAPEPVKPQPLTPVDGQKSYDVPEFDPNAEAAFQSHLSTLIPCTHCSRTFSPDRIQRHESCCIERPKTRDCTTPKGGEIPR